MRRLVLSTVMLLTPGTALAALRTQTVEYKHGDTVLEGYLAYDDAAVGPRPGVVIVHDWTGHNAYARRRAEQVAGLGYVAFAIDMYGKGVRAKTPADGPKLAAPFKSDRALMRARAGAGLDVLKKLPQVDPRRIAAMGYCFGGTAALELARAGNDLAGVVSFHGDLSSPHPNDAKNIKAKVLALHGADDPFVPRKDVAAFEDEMTKGHVDWQLVVYGDAVHSFTNRDAGSDKARGAAYNEKADRRSWEAMKSFFREVLADRPESR
jgi:dienelactone hydrolase